MLENIRSLQSENDTLKIEKEPKPIVAFLSQDKDTFIQSLASFLAIEGFQTYIEKMPKKNLHTLAIARNLNQATGIFPLNLPEVHESVAQEDNLYFEKNAKVVIRALSNLNNVTKNCPIITRFSTWFDLSLALYNPSKYSHEFETAKNQLDRNGIIVDHFLKKFKHESYLNILKLYINELKKTQRIPVLLAFSLSDLRYFLGSFLLNTEEKNKVQVLEKKLKQDERGQYYISSNDHCLRENIRIASMLATRFDLPVISQSQFDPRKDDMIKSIPEILKSMGIAPDKTTLLVDHHVNEIIDEDNFKKSEIRSVEVLPICSCDIKDNYNLNPNKFKISTLPDTKLVKKQVEGIDRAVDRKVFVIMREEIKKKMDSLENVIPSE